MPLLTKAFGCFSIVELLCFNCLKFLFEFVNTPVQSLNHVSVQGNEFCILTVTGKGDIYEENNNEVLVSADMMWSWVDNDNPEERIDVEWALVGQQGDASQAFGSGLTYSNRYFLLKFFNIATPDADPDAFRSKQRAAETAEDKMIAEQIIQSFDETLKEYLSVHKDKTDDVKKFVSKYAKGGNYFAITESVLAGKLLSDFKETFKIEE